ncbi:tumor necrosis factor alpha-induced protein 2 isoform X1 [Apteryx mantelli]|uniref:Tumor necrosis factor alpha-induced protein 2 isoform X1 n=1 Tax=Apteryx mantelli TaxID=2696672 RepID=A0A8B7IDE2_9AVES|nr:PREDICTED: tumor necrosis factor alpha-induced protein 2 isoform X1 [Apteryx mantelli mantelli]XP_013796238.1 PREDICTED: tumor necrosis factor alpha-induced protein 2 isoform X1 [Apteryx mantelli mantelli]XP_013796239.1 PREDICTED: tumor necrosis factor alpha-induced protein 2 isoform X1 [Apteryx mantelli mantelli]
MMKMLPFLQSGPIGIRKESKDCIEENRQLGNPSTSVAEQVPVCPEPSEDWSKDQVKKSEKQEAACRHSRTSSITSNGSCASAGESPEKGKKGLIGILKSALKKKKDSKPLSVKQIMDLIEENKFPDAAQHLIVLEKSLSIKSEEELKTSQQDIESVYEILKRKVFDILKDSVLLAAAKPDLLQQAVDALKEQEKEDQNYLSESLPDQNMQSRPRKWKEVWMATVKESVETRMKDTRRTPTTENLSTAGQNLLHMGKTMKEDLTVVVQLIKQLYPPEFNVCSTYAELYHNYFASQLKKTAESQLEDKDIYLLLSWVHNIYPNDIRKDRVLAKELEKVKLGSLLPSSLIKELEKKYLGSEEATVKNCLSRCLETEIQRWKKDQEPEKLDGHFHSELAILAIQNIHGGQKRADALSAALGEEISPCLSRELAAFLKSYKDAFEDFKEKNKKQRFYKPILIANINNCRNFRDYAEKNIAEKDDDKVSILSTLSDIENSGFDVLLQQLFAQLKPIYKKFTENKWDSSDEIMNEIIKTTRKYISDFQTLNDPFYKAVIEKIHVHLVKEYIVRLLKRRVSLKSPAQQQNLAQNVSKNAAALETFCTNHGSQATWLNSALPKLAEIIRLQDSGAIKIEVATLATAYPDIRKRHLEAFLYIKANLTRGELKSILSYLADGAVSTPSGAPLFSNINVS